MGNRKGKKKWLPLEQKPFPYTKRLYLSPPGMWVIWLWGGNKTRKTKKRRTNPMNEMILFVIGFTVTLAIVVLADVLIARAK